MPKFSRLTSHQTVVICYDGDKLLYYGNREEISVVHLEAKSYIPHQGHVQYMILCHKLR